MIKNRNILFIIILVFIGIIGMNCVSASNNTGDADIILKSTPIKIYPSVYGGTGGFMDGKSPGLYISDEGDNKRVQTIAYKKVKTIKVTTISGKTKTFKDGVNFKNTRCENGYFLNITLVPHTWSDSSGNSNRILILYGDFIKNISVDYYKTSELDPNEPINTGNGYITLVKSLKSEKIKTTINIATKKIIQNSPDITITHVKKKGKYYYITIKNKGKENAKSSYLGIYSRKKLLKKYYISSVKSGKTKILKIKISKKYIKKVLVLKVDYNNILLETNKKINKYYIKS